MTGEGGGAVKTPDGEYACFGHGDTSHFRKECPSYICKMGSIQGIAENRTGARNGNFTIIRARIGTSVEE